MWCRTARIPPSSSPPPARPGPPCTSIGSGLPWPVDSAASSRSRIRSRPCQGASPRTTSRATCGSCVTSEATRLPRPRAARSTASLDGAVGEHRGDRAERLDLVRLGRAGRGPAAGRGRGRPRARRRRRRRRRAPGRRTRCRPRSRSASMALRTSSRWPRLASAPIRTLSSAGSPTVIFARRALIASTTASASASGTMTRRIAVHFWPALTVISVTTPLTNRSNSGSSDRHVGAEDRAVQRVGLDAEADAAVQHGAGARAGSRRCAPSR